MRKDFMVDYKYYCVDNRRSFHRERRAFIVYKNKLDFMPENCDMLHFEYCQTKGISKAVFNKLTRGYYVNGDLVFYRGNFVYDEKLVEHALKYVNKFSEIIKKDEFNIYFGLL